MAIRSVENSGKLVCRKTDELEICAKVAQRGQFQFEQALVPPGIEGKLVIRDHVGPPLRRRPVQRNPDRDLRQSELARSRHTSMTCDNSAALVNQHRGGKPELRNRSRNLLDLRFGVGARITRIGDELLERPLLDMRRWPPG
jgi:hypothetical protein